MKSTLPPLNALRAFEAAARLSSFSAAASELFVTHGAVSKQIKQLESWLGVTLFERRGGRVTLTEPGWRYLVQVQDGFDLIANATHELRQPDRQRRLAINSTPTLAMYWLIPRLPRFRALHPDIEVRIATSDRDISRLDTAFDLAIRRAPADWPGFVSRAFLDEHELPALSPALLAEHPITRVDDLAAHTLLYADTRPNAWARWLTLAGRAELEPAATQHFDHYYLALQAAIDGLGVVLAPLPMIRREIDSGRLVMPLHTPTAAVRGYCWITPRTLMQDPAVTAFCQWLEAEAAATKE
ncbi:transcriptional regulator GcvA [Chitinibacteraceae bacterium HSL-7]